MKDTEQRAPSAQERQLIALRLASPKRADAGRYLMGQHDAGALPLFIAGNEPGLGL